MQEEVRDKSVALVIRVSKDGGRITADMLKWAMRSYLQQANERKTPHGKQTVKQLVGQGAGVKNIEITDKNIKSFERVARKYGVDFALKKDTENGKYLVFFKAKDEDALNAAFSEYAAKTIKRNKSRASVKKMLDHFKEVVKNTARDTEKHREQGSRAR